MNNAAVWRASRKQAVSQIVINYKLVEDVIEGWGYVQVQAPEL